MHMIMSRDASCLTGFRNLLKDFDRIAEHVVVILLISGSTNST